eukprot:TRINITY_DN67679_c7_g4_i1.p1 TRINITY_DN67679_c7_g4~~TRINITY_DN67679_c7_g4_i1.p1  ORF type:complete len:206 (+),score=13.48 TRINITY_DN67679_c7_g4_i1:227-844(+)
MKHCFHVKNNGTAIDLGEYYDGYQTNYGCVRCGRLIGVSGNNSAGRDYFRFTMLNSIPLTQTKEFRDLMRDWELVASTNLMFPMKFRILLPQHPPKQDLVNYHQLLTAIHTCKQLSFSKLPADVVMHTILDYLQPQDQLPAYTLHLTVKWNAQLHLKVDMQCYSGGVDTPLEDQAWEDTSLTYQRGRYTKSWGGVDSYSGTTLNL